MILYIYFSDIFKWKFFLVGKNPRKLQEEEERADSSITKRFEERDDDVSDDDNSWEEGESLAFNISKKYSYLCLEF